MAELATIARPYAEALFQAAKADLVATSEWLDELAQMAEQPQLLAFAGNPKTTTQQVFDLVVGIAKHVSTDRARNFLRTVIENDRLGAVPEMARQFKALKNAAAGSSDAVVYSAFAIEGSALADLQALLEKRFARKLNVSVALAPELIGGVRVVVGDEVLDTSVKARLEQMKAALTA
jgi:F-type H+-transporting ATPase subunit delta